MIKSKKLLSVVAVCAFTAVLSFAQEVSFSNKVSSDVVDISITDAGTETAFSGFKNKTVAEYSSENLDMGLTLKFKMKQEADDSISVGASNFVDDYFIEFRPNELLGIGFHKAYAVAGSYLPYYDAEIDAANIGSDCGLFIRPIDGLVIAAGIDFISYFAKENVSPLFNAGLEYALGETLSFGAAFRDIASDDRTLGAYASFTGVEGLTINAGFTYNGKIEDYYISGNLISAGIIFEKDALGIYTDAVFAAGGDADPVNELYAATCVSYKVNKATSASLSCSLTSDFDNEDSWAIGISPAVDYKINKNNKVGASVFVNIMKEAKALSFPIYWKYSL